MANLLKLALGAAIMVGASPASGHDFFLLPDQFTAPGAGVQNLKASVGSSFPKPENVVAADRVDRLFAAGAGKPQLSVGTAGENALNLRLTGAARGTVVAAVKTKDRDVEYAEDRIPLILEEYRVSSEAVAAIGRLPKPQVLKVNSRRFAKTLVCIQVCGARTVAARPLGADLEFVASGANADRFRLLSLGQPLPDYPVDLVSGDGKRRHLKTDGKGELHVPTDAKGSLMLFAAVMTPPSGGERFTLNLSTLTFARP